MSSGSSTKSFPKRAFRVAQATPIEIEVDGERCLAHEGETLLATLLTQRGWSLRRTERTGSPRGMLCGMGACMQCQVFVEGEGLVQACMTEVRDGMVCRTGDEE